MLKETQTVRALVKSFEDLRLEAYQCSADKWTIGWGHTGASTGVKVTPGQVITYDQGLNLFELDSLMVRQSANRLLSKGIKAGVITQERFDAFFSFVFNIGEDKTRGYTITRLLNEGASDEELAEWWPKYQMAGGVAQRGLRRRRMAELCVAYGLPWQVCDDAPERRWRVNLDTPFSEVKAKALAEAEKLSAPVQKKKPVDPDSVSPEQVGICVDKVKPLEKSKTAEGYVNEKAGEETAKIGGVLTFGSLLGFVQQLATTQSVNKIFLLTLIVCAAAVAFGLIRRGIGLTMKEQGRAESSQAKY